MLKRIISSPYFWACLIDYGLAQSHLLVAGKTSSHPLFEMESGDVEFWVRDLSMKLRIVNLIIWMVAASWLITSGKYHPTTKTFFQVLAYGFAAAKDIFDFLTPQGNHFTLIQDTVILVALLLIIEILWKPLLGWINGKNGNSE